MTIEEHALAFRCHEDWLYGVVSLPPGECTRGVLIVVGGPQYRAGSHRQFTLLARSLAQNGIAAMRFDYRGMGDSQGEPRDFLSVEDDLRAAIDAFTRAVPGLRDIVLWGLCDGASASVTYAATDARVRGLVLLNPWVRTDTGIARTTLKHYYRERLMDAAFWRDVLRGKLSYTRSIKSMLQLARMALSSPSGARAVGITLEDALPDRMYAGMQAFEGSVLVVLSGADLTAREFCDLAQATPKWQRLLDAQRVTRFQLDNADHTFSRQAWRDQVAQWTTEWMRSW